MIGGNTTKFPPPAASCRPGPNSAALRAHPKSALRARAPKSSARYARSLFELSPAVAKIACASSLASSLLILPFAIRVCARQYTQFMGERSFFCSSGGRYGSSLRHLLLPHL